MEPVVISGAQFPAFHGDGPDNGQILLYRWVSGTWEAIPTQVDERKKANLRNNQVSVCQEPFPFFHDPCEWTYVLGSDTDTVAGLDSDDELAFMARDATGDCAPTSAWVGIPGVDTASTRYRITVRDGISTEVGHVYAFQWKKNVTPNPGPSSVDYVKWEPTVSATRCKPDNTAGGNAGCGWFAWNGPTGSGTPARLDLFHRGNWAVDTLCVNEANHATCESISKNVIDRIKYRAQGDGGFETEETWDSSCAVWLGYKDGPVRVIRRSQGTASGRYSTRFDEYYGTWVVSTFNHRAHPINWMRLEIDHPFLSNPPTEDPAVVFTQKNSTQFCQSPMDTLNLTSVSANADPEDWVQVDLTRGGYVTWVDALRGWAPDEATRSFLYQDDLTGDAPETQTGRFGQHGYAWTGNPKTPNADGDNCPNLSSADPEAEQLRFRRFQRIMVPLAAPDTKDGAGAPPCPSGTFYRSDEATTISGWRMSPLLVGATSEAHNGSSSCSGSGTPCKPILSIQLDVGGRSTKLDRAALDACGNAVYGTRIYRGLAPGSYQYVADLGTWSTWHDLNVANNVTYRYVARAYSANGLLGPQSDEVSIAVLDNVAPPLPTNISAVAGSQRVTVSWDQWTSRDIKHLYVNMALSSAGPFYKMNPAGAPWGVTAFIVNGLTPGQTYYFSVSTADFSGNESAASSPIAVVPLP